MMRNKKNCIELAQTHIQSDGQTDRLLYILTKSLRFILKITIFQEFASLAGGKSPNLYVIPFIEFFHHN